MDPKFDFIGKGNRALIEKVKPNMFGPLTDKYPSIYPRGECIELPGWIAFDKQVKITLNPILTTYQRGLFLDFVFRRLLPRDSTGSEGIPVPN